MKIAHRSKQTSEQLAHVTREMYKQNLELAERNKTLTLLRRIDEVVLGSSAEVAGVTQIVANVLVDETDFSFSAIFVTDKYKSHISAQGIACRERIAAQAHELLKSDLASLPIYSNHSVLSQAISTRKVHIAKGFAGIKNSLEPADDKLLRSSLGVSSLFVCPLRASNRFLGVLLIGVPLEEDQISPYLKTLADRLTSTVSIAVENHLLYEEIQDVTARLRIQNRKLKELDKTKDEFISMASHQLRTPLTAVKGYLSMLMEGDAGPIKKSQKELVQRGFDGAQKMVYLIADMLNVSRLQTGKFVIDNKPTDLAAIVEGEVAQLKEQAAARHLELTYQKPAHFPILNLDETKIRQVVMNFLDNAIYYTPSGGKIDAKLEVTDDSVSYSVTDTGLGVPKSVQHHLFSKFYRADNAKKMRPDGTGLGLYMAKKVVATQGGAIIFKSTEGKGSTFGFSFPRKTTELKGQKAEAEPDEPKLKTAKKSV